MDFPVFFSLGSGKLYLHQILEPISYFIGFRIYVFQRRKGGDFISTQNRTWIILGAIFGAIVGSRLVCFFETPLPGLDLNIILHRLLNEKTIVGGLLGGLFGVELTKKFLGEHQRSGDLFVLPILAALFIGRIGCFSMGVFEGAFGTETNGWTGLDQGDGILRHPIMLYELLFLLILFLWFLPKIKSFSSGDAFKHFMVLYLGFRLGIEFFKVRHVLWLGLSSIQWACLLGLIYYADYLFQNRFPLLKIKR